jgi:hypothetical protein
MKMKQWEIRQWEWTRVSALLWPAASVKNCSMRHATGPLYHAHQSIILGSLWVVVEKRPGLQTNHCRAHNAEDKCTELYSQSPPTSWRGAYLNKIKRWNAVHVMKAYGGGQRYSSTQSQPRRQMEVSPQRHAPAALLPAGLVLTTSPTGSWNPACGCCS